MKWSAFSVTAVIFLYSSTTPCANLKAAAFTVFLDASGRCIGPSVPALHNTLLSLLFVLITSQIQMLSVAFVALELPQGSIIRYDSECTSIFMLMPLNRFTQAKHGLLFHAFWFLSKNAVFFLPSQPFWKMLNKCSLQRQNLGVYQQVQ